VETLAAKEAAEKKPIRLQNAAELNERSRQIVEILQGKRRDRQIESFRRKRQIFLVANEPQERKPAGTPWQRRHPDEKGGMKQLEKPRG
jgi:hypothetical protein